MKPIVIIERIKHNEHDDQKWVVLQGRVEGYPQVTKRRIVNSAALASGALVLAGEISKLVADVEEYHARHLAVEAALKEL